MADIANEQELQRFLSEGGKQFCELWARFDDTRLCVLLANDVGWMMCLRFEGDTGLTTRNTKPDGTGTREFILENGQLDAYPAAWCFPRQVVLDGFTHFLKTGSLSAAFNWSELT